MIKDSGDRTQFESGAVRDMHEGKGRCDLLPLDVIAEFDRYGIDVVFANIMYEINKFMESGNYHFLLEAVSDFSENIYDSLLEVAIHFEEGAKKYGEYNWQRGIPVKCYIDSGIRHLLKHFRGDKDERHDRAFVWNILCAIWTCEHMPQLNDYTKDKAVDD